MLVYLLYNYINYLLTLPTIFQIIAMSDTNRKNFADKASESLTPDNQKSAWDKTTEAVSDTYDKAASKLQPEEEKGVFQKISDTISGKKK